MNKFKGCNKVQPSIGAELQCVNPKVWICRKCKAKYIKYLEKQRDQLIELASAALEEIDPETFNDGAFQRLHKLIEELQND